MTENEFKTRYIAARRALIENEFSALNPVQREAVMTTRGPLLLLAGAGSGKTTVLISRVENLLRFGEGSDSDELPPDANEDDLRLLENPGENINRAFELAALKPVEPWRIIAITFTNKAANELKARLEKNLGESSADVWAMTFHSACARILRKDAEKLGFAPGISIYDTHDSQSLIKRIIKERELDEKLYPFRWVLSEISKSKDALVTPEVYAAKVKGDIRRSKLAELYAEYQRRLFSSNAMDFDDLLFFTAKLLTEIPEVRDYYQRRFKYVLIDEYQDTNNLQYIMASALAGGSGNICVVGDDDQSIYKFRGATIENILSFEDKYKNTKVIRLEQNYRSTQNILSAANAVIKNNQGRKGKSLWTDSVNGDLPELYSARNEDDEAAYVAGCVLSAYGSGSAWSDSAVLYRMNAQSNKLEYAFKRNNIPYKIVGGTRFFDRAEVKDMLSYLCVTLQPRDDTRLLRIINNPPRGIGESTIEKAAELAKRFGVSLFEIISNADDFPELKIPAKKLRAFAAMIDEFHDMSALIPVDQLYDEILSRTGYIAALEAKQNDESISRAENVRELKTNILTYIRSEGDDSLAGFLDEVALYTDLDSAGGDDYVLMMTMHSAKGLEFDDVYIVGAEEGIFPSYRTIGDAEEMEEERRLCYVAITRAKKRLIISCARQRTLFGKTSANLVSRFIKEIPPEYIKLSEINSEFGGGRVPTGSAGMYSPKYTATPRFRSELAPKTPPELTISYSVGDLITHSAFGAGTIIKMTPAGGDQLIEIEFSATGKKRLMLKAAARYMTPESTC